MADNVVAASGDGLGPTFATDDVGGVHYPKSKMVWGGNDVATQVASGAAAVPIQDGGNSITVDFSALPAGSNNIGDVDVVSLPSLPAGGNNIGDVDVLTLPSLPAGTNNIGDVDVLTLPALPAGTNNIGDVDIASIAAGTNNIGDVDIASIAAGDNNIGNVDVVSLPAADAQNIADIEAHVSRLTSSAGPVNGGAAIATTAFLAGGTYNATPPTLTDTQQIGLQVDTNGALKISGGGGGIEYVEGDTDASIAGKAMMWEDSGDTLVVPSATKPLPVEIIAGGGSGGTSSTDDGAFTPGGGLGTAAMGIVTTDSVDSGDVGVLGMLANRQLKVTLFDSGGSELAVGGGTQYDEDTVHVSGDKVNMAGVVRSDSASAKSGTDGDRTVLITDANGRLHVNVGATVSTPVTNAGTFAVQENGAALTSLQLLDDAIKTDDAAFTPATDKVLMIGAEADETTPDAVNEGDAGALRMTLNRGLHVNLRAADGTELIASQDATHDSAALTTGPQVMGVAGSAAPTNVTAGDAVRLWALLNGSLAVNVRDSSGNEVSIGGGTQYDEDTAHVSGDKLTMAGVVRSDTPSNKAGTDGDRSVLINDANGRLYVLEQNSGTINTNIATLKDIVQVDDAAFTPAASKIAMAGFTADETATDSVDEGDGGAARMTLDRKLIVNSQPHTTGGLSIHRSIDLDEGTLEVVKASPGCLYGMWVANLATATRFIKFYDATSGSIGTGTPVLTVAIPGNSTDDIAGAFGPGGIGINFTTGICVGASTGIADNDTGAPGANDVIVNVFYK